MKKTMSLVMAGAALVFAFMGCSKNNGSQAASSAAAEDTAVTKDTAETKEASETKDSKEDQNNE